MLLDKFGRLGHIAKLFSSNSWDNRGSIVNTDCPILFIKCKGFAYTASKDEVIPPSQMDILVSVSELFEMDVTKLTIDNGTHGNSWQINPIKYFTQVHLFLGAMETATGV